MANLLAEQLLSLSQAAQRVPPHRGRRTNPSTIFRWLTHGVRLPGERVLRLEGIRLAGRWLTSIEALDRFLAAQDVACNPHTDSLPTPKIRTPGQRRRASERAAKQLARIGI